MLQFKSIVFGCDPEFFFSKNGEVIGAEKVIAENGLEYKRGDFEDKKDGDTVSGYSRGAGNSKIIIDGVQAELNPRANTCRALLAK